jgi:hypothetical protein
MGVGVGKALTVTRESVEDCIQTAQGLVVRPRYDGESSMKQNLRKRMSDDSLYLRSLPKGH